MARFQLSRRTVLRGMGGVAVALPALEAMAPRRALAATPQRFVTLYGGTSLGTDAPKDEVIPLTPGPDWELTPGLQPVGTLGVKKDVALVSALKLPYQLHAGGEVPPGGRTVNFHGNTVVQQVTGMRRPKYDGPEATGPSADQIVAERLSVGTPHKSLAFQVQPMSYQDSTNVRSHLSWGKGGAPIDSIVSPRLAYQSLFSGFQPPTASGTTPNPALALALARRRSVLDLVSGETGRLMLRLGKSDRDRLQSHFDELRALEMRVTSGDTTPKGAGCSRPMDPGTDPDIRGTYPRVKNSITLTAPAPVPSIISGVGYSNEDLRAQILCDLVAMAFACDLSRVASLKLTYDQCVMRMDAISGQQTNMHDLTHNATPRDVADNVAWHVKHFSRLVAKLRDTPDVGGKSILDSAALVLLFEGGHGSDPESGRVFTPHSSERMIALVGGRAGGLKMGQHIVATDKHPAQVVLTAMNAVGVPGGLGEVSGSIVGLL